MQALIKKEGIHLSPVQLVTNRDGNKLPIWWVHASSFSGRTRVRCFKALPSPAGAILKQSPGFPAPPPPGVAFKRVLDKEGRALKCPASAWPLNELARITKLAGHAHLSNKTPGLLPCNVP